MGMSRILEMFGGETAVAQRNSVKTFPQTADIYTNRDRVVRQEYRISRLCGHKESFGACSELEL